MKSTKVIAGLGVVAALGMAVMPFAGTFAETTGTVNVKYTVDNNLALTLDATSKEATITDGEDTSLQTTATVVGNSAYKLDVTGTGLTNGVGGTISAIETPATTLGKGEWGIKVAATGGDLKVTADTFYGPSATALTIMGRDTLADAAIAGDVATVTYGVKTKDNQAAGLYKGTVTYTVAPIVQQ